MARFLCQITLFNSTVTASAHLLEFIRPSSWVWAVNCKRFECLALHLLARHAKHSLTLDHLDETDFAFYFSLIMRHLKLTLPEYNLQDREKILYRHKSSVGTVKGQTGGAIKCFAKFVAYSLLKSSGKALACLKTFLSGIDSYFHPSNTGGWTSELSLLLLKLCEIFSKVVSQHHGAEEGEQQQCASQLLDLRTEFVQAVWPAVKKLCFAKSPFVVLNAVSCAKHLLYLYGDALLTDILTASDYTLSALSEPHRTLSCIALLGRTARLQIARLKDDEPDAGGADGAISILSLLPACIAGLDPNDPFKTATTLNMLASVLSSLRLHPHPLLAEDFCEELVSGILERSFAYIDSLLATGTTHGEHQVQSSTGFLEKAINEAFGHVWSLLFCQVSEGLWAFGFELVEKYLAANVRGGEGAALVALLVRAAKGPRIQQVFDKLFPPLASRVKTLMETGLGTEARHSDEACAALIWHLSCLLGLVHQSSRAALNHRILLGELLLCFSTLRQPRCVQLAGKIVKRLSRSLLDHYPLPNSPSLLDHHGIVVPPVGVGQLCLNWHVPGPLDVSFMHDLLARFYADCLKITAVGGTEGDRTRLVLIQFLECIGTCLLMRPLGPEEDPPALLKQCVSQLLVLSLDAAANLETRGRALEALEKIFGYHGTKEGNLREYERSCRSWSLQMQSYPKEKLAPPSVQSTKVLVCHRRWMAILGRQRALARTVWGDAQQIEQYLKLALGPFSLLRRRAQGILGAMFVLEPQQLSQLLLAQALPAVQAAPEESNLKGLLHMLSSEDPPCRNQVISDPETFFDVIRFGLCMFALPEINSFPGVVDLVGQLLSLLLFTYHPFRADLWAERANVARLVEIGLDQGTNWKAQLLVAILLGNIGDQDDSPSMNEAVARFLLKAMTLEVSQVRSIAVNRGISVLHRYYRRQWGIAVDVDDIDHCGHSIDAAMRGTADGAAGNDESLAREGVLAEILQALPRLFHWLRLETGNVDGTPSFRPDCAELFQTFAELMGGPALMPQIQKGLETDGKDPGGPHFQRACAEAYSGACRGLVLRGETGLDEAGMAKDVLQVIDRAGGECAWMWFEASRFMTDSLAPTRLAALYGQLLEALPSPGDSGRMTSSALRVLLFLFAGCVRGCPSVGFADQLGSRAGELMETANDLIRRSAAFLLVSVMRCPTFAVGRALEGIVGDYSLERCKALLVVVELMCLDPVRTRLWEHATSHIVKAVVRIGEKAEDAELQRESRRILRVLSWAPLAPPAVVSGMLDELLCWLQQPSAVVGASAVKNVLEFATLLYGRNFMAVSSDTARALVQETVRVAAKVDLESRRECGSLLRAIFYAHPSVASEYSGGLMTQMRHASGQIKSAQGVDDRHVLVTATTALILAFPYDIPPWMPALLSLLTRFIHDRYPIYGTARDLFSDFKRTHGDSWQQDREKFTEHELDAINELLVAPSYYA